eukprot:CAMPEP_0198210070 /NCGR_PEP_ID=MMETSP1445-20131203/19058_1 /TAXON_ID=36898 /ORGANISM="Pyramimonas sp., Strain CCMP2087" /LENGTH=143 /DNA_ID=CAMNT_0043884035 /DNA_START=57 /DNA_END=488 /DNA_ORIENTATION=+
MDDPQLEAIRQQRMAQLGAQGGMPAAAMPAGAMPEGMSGGGDPQQQEAQQEQKKAQDQQRAQMLQTVLQPAARERLTRISLVKPEKARKVEDMILKMAQGGKLGEPVSENQLIKWLEQITEGADTKAKVTLARRRDIFDDNDW